jgi:uncharacterized surface protein with fasciclin (FAS1) repeats
VTMLTALILLASATGAADYASTAGNKSQKNIVETAIAAGNFNTLVEAVKAAGLVETLSSPGPFTVFAPTDEAFSKVPKPVLDALMANKTLLTAVLTYHVVPGEVMSSDLKNGMSLKTAEGDDVKITIDPAGVMLNNAKVVKTDINASNGVIHVIDAVILPPVAAKAVEATSTVAAAAEKAEGAVKKTEGTAKQAEATAQKSMPGFESIFAIAGLLSVAFAVYCRQD